jgi:hypothetical protein
MWNPLKGLTYGGVPILSVKSMVPPYFLPKNYMQQGYDK